MIHGTAKSEAKTTCILCRKIIQTIKHSSHITCMHTLGYTCLITRHIINKKIVNKLQAYKHNMHFVTIRMLSLAPREIVFLHNMRVVFSTV